MQSLENLKLINRLLLFSNFSNSCKQFQSVMVPQNLNMFTPICIDNPEIREMILNSGTEVRVNFVPCILEVYSNGIVDKYESKNAFDRLKQLQNSTIKNVSSINDLQIMEPVESVPQQRYDKQARHGPINLVSREADIGAINRGGREKLDMMGSRGLMSNRDIQTGVPARGEGHENMQSSLSDLQDDDLEEPQGKIIQDLDQDSPDVVDDIKELSGMNVERADSVPIANPISQNKSVPTNPRVGTMSKRTSVEKGKTIKDLAKTMASAREMTDISFEKGKKRRT